MSTSELDAWEAELLASTPTPDTPTCGDCLRHRNVRRWPLTGVRVCASCWAIRVRKVVTTRWQGNTVHVFTRHPQFGDLHRGQITMVGQDGATLAWRIQDCDHTVIDDRFVGDYIDAETQLLEATSGLDEIEEPK